MKEFSKDDVHFMDEALALGRQGLGTAAPNPSVGAILVKDGRIVGRGFTAAGGRPHAEWIALEQAGDRARASTLFVTLEPCAHAGRGPACADAIIAAGVARVVAATGDPDPRTAGEGFARLRAAGVAVDVGLRAEEARRAQRGHELRIAQGRPMVTLKLAQTPDGYAAGLDYDPRLSITGEAANVRVHMMRAEHDVVMVGAGTVRADDPLLTVRLPGATQKPLRVVLDSMLSLSPRSRLVATAHAYPILVLTTEKAPQESFANLQALGVTVEQVPSDQDGYVDLRESLRALARRGAVRVFSEGGPRVGGKLIALGLADEVAIFTGFKPLGREGLPALSAASRSILEDPSHYRLVESASYGPDRLSIVERIAN